MSQGWNKEKQIGDFSEGANHYHPPPPPPNILEIPIKVQFSDVTLVSTLFKHNFYLSSQKATHNVNSSTWTKNLVTQLDNNYNIMFFKNLLNFISFFCWQIWSIITYHQSLFPTLNCLDTVVGLVIFRFITEQKMKIWHHGIKL